MDREDSRIMFERAENLEQKPPLIPKVRSKINAQTENKYKNEHSSWNYQVFEKEK